MTDDVTVRVDGDVAVALRPRAERLGISLNKLVSQVLRREVEVGPIDGSAPQVLPVGVGPASSALEGLAQNQKHNWLVLYRDARGVPLLVAGRITQISPMFLELEVMFSSARMTIPRVELLGWEHVPDLNDSQILDRAVLLQRWGAYLHELVQIDGRDANRVYWPPDRGPILEQSTGPRRRRK